MSSSSKYVPSFAPYTPPPDDPSYTASSSKPTSRAWFPPQSVTSYQSGGLPTFNTSQGGGAGAVEDAEQENGTTAWETRFGTRVDLMAACSYLLGPISALLLLILETHNDYVRFHAYQAALLSVPLLLIRFCATIMGFAPFLRTVLTFVLVIPCLYMTWRAYIDAARNGLSRFLLPGIGPIAERWVFEE
ncbi:hypothetical protein ABKN59_001217 [Abortiporus biennis]